MRGRSRPVRSPGASAPPSTISSSASRRSWAPPPCGRARPCSGAALDERAREGPIPPHRNPHRLHEAPPLHRVVRHAGTRVIARALRAGAITIVALAILAFGGQSLGRVWQMKREVDGLEREIAALRAETDRLSTTVNQLRSDPDSIERVAREELGFVKPGERVLKLPPSKGQ